MTVPAIVVATPDQLRNLIVQAVLDAVGEHKGGAGASPELVTGAELARLLSVSRTTVHRLRLEGMPAVRMGDTFRYHLGDCLAWLKARNA